MSPNHSKSWLTKALRKVLKVPSTYSNSKSITKDVIEDQSLMMASSNGFQNTNSDVEEGLKTEARSNDGPQTEKNELVCSRTKECGELKNNVVTHEKCKSGKKSDMIGASTKKKSSSSRNSNLTSQSNEYSKKRFVRNVQDLFQTFQQIQSRDQTLIINSFLFPGGKSQKSLCKEILQQVKLLQKCKLKF